MTSARPAYSAEELAGYPASELFHLLIRNEDRVPRTLIEACARREDEMLDVLEPILAKDYYWSEDTTDGEWWLRFHAVSILGLIAGQRAGDLLVAFMRRMDEAQDESLEDWLSGYWPAFFRNKPETIVESLRALAQDRNAGAYIRSEAAQAAVACAQHFGAVEPALAWAASIAFKDREDPDLRGILGSMLLDFARPEFRRKLEQIADLPMSEGLPTFDRQEITQVYFARGRAPQWEWEDFKDPWRFYEADAIAAREVEWARADAELAEERPDGEGPYVREAPKVGRNDPCPCGSGKKFKKCCGV